MRDHALDKTTRQALSLLTPLSAIFLANKILQTRLMLPEDVRQLHENITVSWSQGQLAIDLFAPLSHVTGAKPWVNTARLWIWPLFAVIWIGHFAATPWLSRSRFCWLLLLITTAVAIVSFQGMNRSSANDDVLLSCNGLSDGVLFIALTLTASIRRPGRYLWYGLHAGLADALIWTSIGLGGNLVDFSLALLHVIVWRIHAFSKTLSDQRTSMLMILAKAIASFSISLLAWPIVYTIIIGNVLPWSESATDMNHNLHYLSPAARRHMTPFPSIIDVQCSETTSRDLGVYSGAQYTLYMPGAGFLWSDNLVWVQRLPGGDHDSGNDTAGPWAIDEARRVYFQDRNVRRHPWLIEPVMKQQRMKMLPEGILRSGASVRMMDPDSNEYLCVNPGQHVVSEAGYFPENGGDDEDGNEDIMTRFAIGVQSETTPHNCEWRIYYNVLQTGNGIVVFNEQNNCRLATTFRSLPADISGPRHNDSNVKALHQLEASCTVLGNDASSYLYPIERRKGGSKASRERRPTNAVLRSLMIGYEYHRAVHKLGVFQARYPDLQQGQGGSAPRVHGSAPGHNLLSLGCILFLCAWIGVILARKRKIMATLHIQPGMEGVFVLLHIGLYYVWGLNMLYSSRVAGLMAISGSTRLLQEAVCILIKSDEHD